MSKSKYKKYQGKKFECIGLGKCTDSSGVVRADTSTRIYESMLVSQAFTTLTPKQQILYVYCKAQYYGKTKPANEYKELGLYQDDSYFYLSLKMVKTCGIYAAEKGSTAIMLNEKYNSVEDLRKSVSEYKLKGFKVYYNDKNNDKKSS